MAKKFVQKGDNITVTAVVTAAVAGTPYLLNNLIVIPHTSAAIGEEFEAAVNGVWNFPKTSADTPSQFDNAYWDATAGEVTTTSTANTLLGVFMNDYANGDTDADVRLNGVSV